MTTSDTNRAVQSHKMATDFQIQQVDELYYPCSENTGTDQLCGYREADMAFVSAYAKSRFSYDMDEIDSTDCVGGENEKY